MAQEKAEEVIVVPDGAGSYEEIRELANLTEWILDVDDCLYPMDNKMQLGEPGLHAGIKELIIENWNNLASDALKTRLSELITDVADTNPAFVTVDSFQLRKDDLKVAFPHMLRAIEDAEPDKMFEWLSAFYGDMYAERLAPDPDLVMAFKLAAHTGVRITLYTNGPSHPEQGVEAHVQKVLRHIGFDEPAIEALRLRTQDMIMNSKDGSGKPCENSMQTFLQRFNIEAGKALMADDTIMNLKTAEKAGIRPVWTWTSDVLNPHEADAQMAEEIGAIKITHTGKTLLRIAQARLTLICSDTLASPACDLA
ncbi:MAG: hypothetical protein LRY36_00115 [Alphaproteobacteria bacterium]|nr:hypothetical protein [Alphaproteobacteria bacterium]MCD8566342.1 hypothetical protein [Alphaproteobacteria bacterium]